MRFINEYISKKPTLSIIFFVPFSIDYNEDSSSEESEYEQPAHHRYPREKRAKKNDRSDEDITPPPSPPRYTSSGRLIQKTRK